MQRISAILILISTFVSSTTIVKWLPNKSFNLPINFKDGKLPCSKQTVVFPKNPLDSIKLESNVAVNGLVLPDNGEIILDGAISFGALDGDNCTDDSNAYYSPRATSSWGQPDVWSSPRFNKATPDAERIPCYDDKVVFPEGSQFTIYLPYETQYIRALEVDDVPFDTFKFKLLAMIGFHPTMMFVVNSRGDSGVVVKNIECLSKTGCPCQQNTPKIDCSAKFCSVPQCVKPIKPIGDCCKICGGYVVIDIDESFDFAEFEESVASTIDYYGKDKVVYHIGRLPDNKIQVVVVDKDEYIGSSSEVLLALEGQTNKGGVKVQALSSGGPLYLSGYGGKITVTTFFLVLLSMALIFVYFYRTPEMRIPSLPSISLFGNRGRGMLSRFNRRTDSVVSLTSRRGSTATLGFGTSTASGFRNPLYNSKREKVEVVKVAETVVEE